jgi:hypothetical protein
MLNTNEKKNLLQRISVKRFRKDYTSLTYTEMRTVASILKKAVTVYKARLEHNFV